MSNYPAGVTDAHEHFNLPSAGDDAEWIECEKCEGFGFIEYQVDHFGRKLEWGVCNAPGCVNGLIETEAS